MSEKLDDPQSSVEAQSKGAMAEEFNKNIQEMHKMRRHYSRWWVPCAVTIYVLWIFAIVSFLLGAGEAWGLEMTDMMVYPLVALIISSTAFVAAIVAPILSGVYQSRALEKEMFEMIMSIKDMP